MSNIFKISGALVLGKFSTAPASPSSGYVYYDTTLNRYRMYNSVTSQWESVELNLLVNSMSGDETDKAPSVSAVKSHVSSAVSAEASRAQSVESAVSSAVSVEISRAQSAESSLASSLSSSVSSEASSRSAADSSLASLVSAETSSRLSADTSLTAYISASVGGGVSAEESARVSADASLNVKISTEVSRASSAESSLASSLSSSISSEASSRSAADSSLTTRVSAEESARVSASSSLTARVSSEESRAASAESSLSTQISSSVSSEASSRADADSSLESLISAEESRASSAESSLDSKVSSETSRASSAESSLSSRVSSEESTRLSASTSLSTQISSSVSSEASSRTAADSSLASLISAETSRAQSAENAFDGMIDNVASDLSNEVSSRTAADSSLTTRVSAEESVRLSASSSLTTRVSSEESRAASAELSLANLVSSAGGSVSAEQSRAQSAEASLASSISSEASSRTAADSSLESVISSEASSRTAADSSLATQISSSVSSEASSRTAADSSLATSVSQKVSKSGDTMTGNLNFGDTYLPTGLGAPVNANDAVRKSYVDALVSGTTWLNPINDPDLVRDNLNTPPGTPVAGEVHIIGASPTGAWSSIGAGHAVFWDGSTWVDLLGRAVQAGDRFGVAFYTASAAAGGLVGKEDYIAEIATATPGSITYTFTAPSNGKAVYVNDHNSGHFGHSYLYTTETNSWVEFGGPGALEAGVALNWSGNTLNVNLGKGVSVDLDDKIIVDLYSAGGLQYVNPADGSASSADNAEIAIKLDGATLSKSASGVKVAAGGISNTEIAAGAAIAFSKMAALTSSKALVSDASGVVIASSVTSTELGYLSGVTSAIQTQLNGKLANVVEDTTPELGGNLDVNGKSIEGASSDIVLAGQNSVKRAKQASKSSFIEEEYIHAITLNASQTDTVASALTFAHATVGGLEIAYKMKDALGKVRIGTLRVVTNGVDNGIVDTYTETSDLGVTWSVAINGTDVEVKYSTGASAVTMRADVKKILA